MTEIPASALQLGDIVKLGFATGYDTATVKQVKNGLVTFFRPYVATEDFSYTGGVICLIGIEEFSVAANDQPYTVVRRVTLK